MTAKLFVPLLLVAGAAGPARPDGSAPRAADLLDVATLDGILAAVYDVISGPAGGARDWDRFHTLFHPELARLMPVGRNAEGQLGVRALTPAEYVERTAPLFAERGFYESEVARRVERFGHIAHVFSTYESRDEPAAKPFARGINSIQLLWDDERWWVLAILWDQESPEQPLPAEYLETRR